MDKLKINLVPPEIKERAKKEAKRSLVIRISMGLLGLLIVFTSGILGVIIFQSATLQSLNSGLEREKSAIANLREKEAVVFLLKNRIDTINQFTDDRYKQGQLFELVTGLFPTGVNLTSLEVNETEEIAIQGETRSTTSLQSFFNNLTDPKVNEGKIASVAVESLSKGQSGQINFSLVVNLAQGVNK